MVLSILQLDRAGIGTIFDIAVNIGTASGIAVIIGNMLDSAVLYNTYIFSVHLITFLSINFNNLPGHAITSLTAKRPNTAIFILTLSTLHTESPPDHNNAGTKSDRLE